MKKAVMMIIAIIVLIYFGAACVIIIYSRVVPEDVLENQLYIEHKLGIHREEMRGYINRYKICPSSFDDLVKQQYESYKSYNDRNLLENNDMPFLGGAPYAIIDLKNICCIVSTGQDKKISKDTTKRSFLEERLSQYPQSLNGQDGVWSVGLLILNRIFSGNDDIGTCLPIQ